MMIECYYTSFTFAIVAIISKTNKWIPWMNPMYTFLTGTSVLYHSKYDQMNSGQHWMYYVDKTLAHVSASLCFLHGVYLTYTCFMVHYLTRTYLIMFWIFAYSLFHIYYVSRMAHLPYPTGKKWHALLHVLSASASITIAKAYEVSAGTCFPV